MLQGGARRFAEIFEDHDILEAGVAAEIDDAVTESEKDIKHSVLGKIGKGFVMVRRFDDDFMGADAVHFVVQAFPFLVQLALNDQGRVFIRHHPQRPARGVGLMVDVAVAENLRRRGLFIARAKRTKSPFADTMFNNKVCRALSPFLGNNNPAAEDRVFS